MMRKFSILASGILFIFLGLLLISSSFATFSSSTMPTIVAHDQDDTNGLVKILNYNTIEAGRYEEWLDVVKGENPDIFIQVETGFIENLEPWKDELNAYFDDQTPYEVFGFDGTSGTDGQAIYTRYPIVSTNVLYEVTLDDGTTHKMNHPYTEVVLDIHGENVYIFANHLSCCSSYDARMLEQEGLMNYFDTLGDVPIIYGGDFNSDSPEDVGKVAPFQGTLGVEPVEMMINSSFPTAPVNHVFTDTYRALNPDRKGYTLNHEGSWESIDHFRGRIDYIFVNQYLTDNMVNSSVVTDADYEEILTASDHKPMYTWFNFNSDVDHRPPVNPQNVVLNSVSTTSVTLSWDTNSEIDLASYRIYRNGSIVGEVETGTTQFTDSFDDIDTNYIYEVSAIDTADNEGRRSLATVAKTSQGELFAPYNIEIQAYGQGGSTFLNWSITGDSGLEVKELKLYKTLDLDGVFAIDKVIANPGLSGETSFSVDPSFDLKLKVSAVNVIGESDLSPAAYPSYSGDPIVVDVNPDSSNTYQYGELFEDLVYETPGDEVDGTNSTTTTQIEESTPSTEEETSFPIIYGMITVLIIPVVRKRFLNTHNFSIN